MNKEQIIETLNEWNFWNKSSLKSIPREFYIEKLDRLSKSGQVIVLTGARRTGKSTLMRQFILRKMEAGEDKSNFLYVNFEEPRFISELNLDFLQKIYEAYLEVVQPSSKPHILLDEVQLVPGWEKFVRSLHETERATFLVSGSSAKLLSKEFATVLTGRHLDLEVYPLSFTEFLRFRNIVIHSWKERLAHQLEIKRALREYLEYGGFPLVALSEEKKALLTNYFEDIINKDIVERYKVKKSEKVKSLAKFYLSNVGGLASYRKIKEFLGISLDSVERFSEYLKSAYMIFLVSKFSYSFREQEINPRKIYCLDNGLKNLVGFKFSQDLGHAYENVVFMELIRRGKEVFYWKGNRECDFIIKEGNAVSAALQVCVNAEKREKEGLLEALREFKLKEGIIVTEDRDEEIVEDKKKIRFIPLWKWLLKENEAR